MSVSKNVMRLAIQAVEAGMTGKEGRRAARFYHLCLSRFHGNIVEARRTPEPLPRSIP